LRLFERGVVFIKVFCFTIRKEYFLPEREKIGCEYALAGLKVPYVLQEQLGSTAIGFYKASL
jgi:hypothetical protein